MAKKNSEKKTEVVVSVLGMIEAIVIALVRCIWEAGGNVGECLCYLASAKGEGTIKKIAELIAAEAKAAAKTAEVISQYWESTWEVMIDYGQYLGQMVSAGGYNYADPDITAEHFPVKGTGQPAVKVELLCFNCYFSNSDEVVAMLEEVNQWLAEQGAGYRYRLARIEELLALGAAHRDLQREYRIAALGSIWRQPGGSRSFAYLDGSGAGRFLGLDYLKGGFDDRWRFAVVREQS